ncbi:response regulator [Ferrovibrio xuzhouensis]|uniref:Response regulator n=1 Tax=Ferrovibrio xuzhouensis TaxID=1576914 RepID=A0ABV7VFS2_9PROT
MSKSNRVDPAVFRRASILVAEGDRALRRALRDVLLGMGFPTIYVSGTQADTLRQIGEREPSVILLDNSLPGGNGLALTRRLRQHGGMYSQSPIVLMIAAPDVGLVAAARDAGVNEIVVKPVSMEALVLRLMHVLKAPRPFIRSTGFVGPDRRRLGERRTGERRNHPAGGLRQERRQRPSRRTGHDRRHSA